MAHRTILVIRGSARGGRAGAFHKDALFLSTDGFSGDRGLGTLEKGQGIGHPSRALLTQRDRDRARRSGADLVRGLRLDYRQPSKIWEFFFGLLRGKKLRDAEVDVTGWYRRAPVPYVELNSMRVGGTRYTCYVYHIKLVLAALLVMVGLIVTLGGFM
jgi:hypothetical protein